MFSRVASYVTGLLIASLALLGNADERQDPVDFWEAQTRHPAAAFRQRATDELARMGAKSHSALPAVRDRLGDIDAKVRLSAVQAIALIQAQGTLAEAELASITRLVPLLEDSDEHVRYAAEWALARFALRAVDEKHAAEFARELGVAIQVMLARPHHERHFRVINELHQQLQQPPQQELAHAQPMPPCQQPLSNSQELWQEFETADTVTQLAMIHQLTPVAGESFDKASNRRRVLRSALIDSSSLQVHFALKRWETAGQLAIREIFDGLPDTDTLPEWSADVLFELVPRRRADIERLLRIVAQSSQPNIVRTAAVSSLGRSEVSVEERCASLIRVLPLKDQTIRAEAILQLAALCERNPYENLSESSQVSLVNELQTVAEDSSNYFSTRLEAVIGLAKLQHPLALRLIEKMLKGGGLKGYQYPRLVDAVVAFGRPTKTGERTILQSLQADDEFAQEAALKAIGKLRFPPDQLLPAVLQFVADNRFGSEKYALEALAAFGPEELKKSLQFLTMPCEGLTSQDRALAIIAGLADLGQRARLASRAFSDLALDQSRPIHLRVAAAFALEQVALSEEVNVEQLKTAMVQDHDAEMRAALLLSLAKLRILKLDDIESVPFADSDETGRVVKAVARHAIDPARGTDELIAMLGGPAGELAEQALVDFGPAVAANLQRIVRDSRAQSEKRVRAMGVLTRIPAKDYKPLISTLADETIAEPCTDCLYGLIDSGDGILEDLVSVLDELPDSKARERVASLIETYSQGVGAGGEDGERFAALGELNETLMYQAMDRSLDQEMVATGLAGKPQLPAAAAEVFEASPAPAVPYSPATSPAFDQPTARVVPQEANESWAADARLSQAEVSLEDEIDIELFVSSEESKSVSSSIAFDLPYPEDPVGLASLELPATESPEVLLEEATDESGLNMFREKDSLQPELNSLLREHEQLLPRDRSKVKVFYGTNREATVNDMAQGSAVRWLGSTKTKAVAILVSIAVIAVCVFGFLRQRALLYSVFAVGGLCLVIGLGVANLRERPLDESRGPMLSYSGRYSSELSLGVCEVSLPENHVKGELESKSFMRFEVTNNPQKHVVLKKTTRLSEDQFFDELRQETDLRGNSLLVFIHGYNVSFVDAARRTAQLAYDLEYQGAPVFYSWPSNANWYQYQLDKKNVQLSVGLIKDFLVQLSEDAGVDTINVIAHSMGNVGLTAALSEMEVEEQAPPFNQVVLAAPDLDADIFEARIAPKIVNKARRFTLYTSSGDLALIASRYFNAGRRLGESGDPVAAYPGIDVIDASGVDTSLLGHSYYGSSRSVISDLGELLKDHPVHYRDHLQTASSMGRNYWVLESPIVASRSNGLPGIDLR